MFLVVLFGKNPVDVSVETDEGILGLSLFVGMHVIGHNGNGPGDNAVPPGKMIVKGQIEYDVPG